MVIGEKIFKRNISSLLKSASPDDQIIISDLDEIPNLEK